MGIDLLDVVFRIEKTFGIRFPIDAWWEAAGVTRDEVTTGFDVTAGQLYECILSRLSETPDGFRPPRIRRDALRDRLCLFFKLRPGEVGMESELERLLTHPDRQAEWSDLARFLNTSLPQLRRPVWLSVSIALRVMAMLAVGLALTPQRNSAAAWLLALVVSGIVWLTALGLTASQATLIPRQCRTVADLHRTLSTTSWKLDADENGPWTRDDVWETLQEILVECLAVERAEVTPDARLMADLGAG